MIGAAAELDWATRVIAFWSGTDLRTIDAHLNVFNLDGHRIEITEITLTVNSTTDATQLANLLHLAPETGQTGVLWLSWSGWVSEASTQGPALVRVTAPIAGTEVWS